MTPHQVYAILFDDRGSAEAESSDPLDQLHRANHDRAKKGLKPVFPALVKFNVPRVKP